MPGSALVHTRFGDFEVDFEAGELFGKGKRTPVQAKAFELLHLLLERRGSLVTREELACRLWPDTNVEVRVALNVTVHKLRQALCDSAQAPHFIETVGSRGYRFLTGEETAQRLNSKPAVPSGAGLRIVFMPLRNLGSPEHDAFAEVFIDRLIAWVAKICPAVTPVIPAITPRHRYSERDAAQICRETGTECVLTSNFMLSEGNVCVTAKLIRGEDHTCLWADNFTGKLTSLVQTQDSISTHFARSLAHRIVHIERE
jgi:DNA-binding winged helix-turn-helix (wHTH) protein